MRAQVISPWEKLPICVLIFKFFVTLLQVILQLFYLSEVYWPEGLALTISGNFWRLVKSNEG